MAFRPKAHCVYEDCKWPWRAAAGREKEAPNEAAGEFSEGAGGWVGAETADVRTSVGHDL